MQLSSIYNVKNKIVGMIISQNSSNTTTKDTLQIFIQLTILVLLEQILYKDLIRRV